MFHLVGPLGLSQELRCVAVASEWLMTAPRSLRIVLEHLFGFPLISPFLAFPDGLRSVALQPSGRIPLPRCLSHLPL